LRNDLLEINKEKLQNRPTLGRPHGVFENARTKQSRFVDVAAVMSREKVYLADNENLYFTINGSTTNSTIME